MQYQHVTLQLLWEEYCLSDPDTAYGYSSFSYKYSKYRKKLDVSMRQTHRAGQMTFVDFAGRTVPYKNRKTGEELKAQIFIGALGCSNLTFAYALRSQSIPDWIDAHNQMFKYYGGTTEIIVPDNLKSAVIHAGLEPEFNRTYLEMAKHYGIVIVPARVRKPKDKSKAELAVLIVSRWILARLRKQTFFSIGEINAAISELLKMFNERPFKQLPDNRRIRFEQLDKPLLAPLPDHAFEYAEWSSFQTVRSDYHVRIKDHYYSVPHPLIGQKVEARITQKVIEILHQGKRVASHSRNFEIGGHTTLSQHQTKAHRKYAEQSPEQMIQWAEGIGEACLAVIQFQFSRYPHALLGIKACSTLKRLAKDYGNERTEIACQRAQAIGSLTVKSVKSILQRGLTELHNDEVPIQTMLPLHFNVRGAEYYSSEVE